MRRTLIAIAAAAVLAGCGNDQTPPPDIGRIPPPAAFRDEKFARDGISFRAPTNWRVTEGAAQNQVATVAVGDAQIAVWRYPRTEPLPETRDQLAAARDALVAQVKSRDKTFRLKSSRLVMKERLNAVELVASVTNQGRPRRVRSLPQPASSTSGAAAASAWGARCTPAVSQAVGAAPAPARGCART